MNAYTRRKRAALTSTAPDAQDRPITVFFEATDFLPLLSDDDRDWVAGGAEVQQSYLAQGFAHDPRFRVVLADTIPRPSSLDSRFSYVQIPAHIKRGLPYVGRLINAARSSRTFDDIELPAVFLQTQFERLDLTYAARGAGIKIVRWINGDSIVDVGPDINEITRMHIERRVKPADALVAQSTHQQRLIANNLNRESTVIGSMVPVLSGGDPLPQRFAAQTALWVGRCHPMKNPQGYLDLVAKLPDINFIMVAAPCDAKQSYQDEIIAHAQNLPNVEFFYGLSLERTQQLYAHATLCVNTSDSEGMPNTFIESSLAGIPTAALSVNPEGLFIEENGCFCAQGDIDALATWIRHIMGEYELYADRCGKVADMAQHQWNDQQVIDDYYQLFRQVTSSQA